ncbi:hypothetical protein ANN_26785 [Periplaneta americana]|uniref:Uncharacterized protein n=1 Tax=Periplaneta americana TaxID=6978 RepID=A0ABQ8RZ07_PERAM|nr:hypothetical protein ANN_26785 [Periplaneta americana]
MADQMRPELFRLCSSKENWALVRDVITLTKIQWAIYSFDPYKSAGPDQIIPALLQQVGLTEVEGAAVSTTTGDTKPDSDCQLLIPKTLWRRVRFIDESRFSLQMDVKECGEEKENVFFMYLQLRNILSKEWNSIDQTDIQNLIEILNRRGEWNLQAEITDSLRHLPINVNDIRTINPRNIRKQLRVTSYNQWSALPGKGANIERRFNLFILQRSSVSVNVD